MKKITFILAAFMLLSISCIFAQAPPQLLFPINGQSVDPDQPTFQIEQFGWELTGTFEIYVDIVPIDPLNPGIPVYVGPLEPPPPPDGRTLLEYHMAALMDEQAYYWFVRYSNGVDYWASVVQNFITGVSTQTKYTIQGNIQSQSPLVSVGGVNLTCPGACYPPWCNTSSLNNGFYKFQAYAGASCVVTPTKTGHYFNPLSRTYSNISQNFLNDNYWIISMNPNKSGLIYPGYGSVNLPVMLPHLQWEYSQNPAYTMPDRFTVWFGPMGASVPVEDIDYVVDGVYTYEFIPPDIPLDYGTEYEWKVVPTNDYGPAEDIETWTFTTENPPLNPLTLVSPLDGAGNLTPEEVTLEFEHSLWQIDSFFDIFVDMDPGFPEEPVYSGFMVPVSGNLFNHNIGPLMAEQPFYWKVRVTQGADQWTSAVYQFTTTTYVVPTHSVSGTTYSTNGIASGGRKITYYANNVYVGFVNSSLNPPYGSYTIYLPDVTNVVYKVVPVKPSYIQYWSPTWRTYSNLTADQTGDDYYLNYFTPNPAIQPIPTMNAHNVSINVGQLQWTYIQQAGYGTPTGFDVYFPANSPVPYATVVYAGRDPEYWVYIPPLEYGTPYTWKVVPFNNEGEAEYIEEWNFYTEEDPYPPSFFEPVHPLYVMHDVEPGELIMVWKTGGKADRDWPVDSFFDVYLAEDQGPFEQVYSGPGNIESTHPLERFCYITEGLALDTHYHWYVRLTSLGIQHYSDIWDFYTAAVSNPPSPPVLHSPVNGTQDVPPGEVLLVWEQNPWHVDSFFDVYFDINPIDPDNPDAATLIYHGPGEPHLRTYFEWHCAAYMTEETYYWFVRYSNFVDYWYGKSPVGTFETGMIDEIVPGIPEPIIPPLEAAIPGVTVETPPETGFSIPYVVVPYDGLTIHPPNPNLNNANCYGLILSHSGGTADVYVYVPSGTWYIIVLRNGVWYAAVPFPVTGPGYALLQQITFGDKSEVTIVIAEGEGNDPTLPVELSSFNAVVTAEQFVNLTWVVQSETNLMGYYVLRNESDLLHSALTLNPSPITEGSALGTQITYHYTDAQVEQDYTYYYWLNSMDLDGSTHFYGPVSVTISGDDPDDPIPEIPLKTELLNAYPNPFFTLSYIPFAMKTSGDVKIDIYNCKGQLVWTHSETGKQPGYHKFIWDGKDQSGKELSSGIYYYLMSSGKYSAGKKVVLMK